MVTGMFAPKPHDGADNGTSANGADISQVLRDVEKSDNALKQGRGGEPVTDGMGLGQPPNPVISSAADRRPNEYS